MVEEEDADCTSSQKHIKNISTRGANLTENNFETGRKTLVQQRFQERYTHNSEGREERDQFRTHNPSEGTQKNLGLEIHSRE